MIRRAETARARTEGASTARRSSRSARSSRRWPSRRVTRSRHASPIGSRRRSPRPARSGSPRTTTSSGTRSTATGPAPLPTGPGASSGGEAAAAPSHPREPLVPLVLPVPAGTHREEAHLGEVLHHLVAELHGGVEAQRRAVLDVERLAVHAVGEDRLRVERALQVPGGPVARVEGPELDVPRPRVHPGDARDLREPHAVPRRDRRPALDAVVPDAGARPRQPLELGDRERERAGDEPLHRERPARGRDRELLRDLVLGEVLEAGLLVLAELRGEPARVEERALEPLVHALHQAEEARVRTAGVAGEPAERDEAGAAEAAREEAAPGRSAHEASSSRSSLPSVMSARVRGWSSTSTTGTIVKSASAASTRRWM